MNHVAQNNVSEVARIRASIEAECQALAHLSLFTNTARHDTIANRFKALDTYHNELKELVGDKEATSTLISIYNDAVQ
jgi:hypothetical protein